MTPETQCAYAVAKTPPLVTRVELAPLIAELRSDPAAGPVLVDALIERGEIKSPEEVEGWLAMNWRTCDSTTMQYAIRIEAGGTPFWLSAGNIQMDMIWSKPTPEDPVVSAEYVKLMFDDVTRLAPDKEALIAPGFLVHVLRAGAASVEFRAHRWTCFEGSHCIESRRFTHV